MELFLTTLLRLSVLGSALALVLLLVQRLLRGRGSQTVCYYLWLVVLLRLCVPMWATLSLPVAVPDMPTTPVLAPVRDGAGSTDPLLPNQQGDIVPAKPDTPPSAALPAAPAEPETRAEMGGIALGIVCAVWGLGAFACVGRYVWSYRGFSRRVYRNAVPASPEAVAVLRKLSGEGRVRLLVSEEVNSPLLIGLLRPTIVLPCGVTAGDRLSDILAHELTHAVRHDLLFKWFAALVTSLHWFNPLMVPVRREIARACELSCDAAVLRKLDEPGKRRYGETLLALAADSSSGSGSLAVTLCEEKKQLKERLVAIVKYRKRSPAAVVLAALLVVILCGCATIGGAKLVNTPTESPSPATTPTEAPDPTTTPTEAPDPTTTPTEAPNPTDRPDGNDPTTPGAVQLTQAEIDRVNEALASTVSFTDEYGFTYVTASEISCFFTSEYATPAEIDLAAFLRYAPFSSSPDIDSAEFRAAVTALGYDPDGTFDVPLHRFRKDDVSAVLKKYAGITVDDLNSVEGVAYLEEYDAFYNCTSDFGSGVFDCIGGERTGDTVRLWSGNYGSDSATGVYHSYNSTGEGQTDDPVVLWLKSRELTIREVDGTYYIQSHLCR